MSHGYTALGAIGPEPNEGHPINAFSLHGYQQQLFAQVLNSRVHWPTREEEVSPAVQMNSLNMPSDLDMHQRPHEVIRISQRSLPPVQSTMVMAFCVPLKTQVIDDVSRIKWETHDRAVSCYIFEGVIKARVDSSLTET